MSVQELQIHEKYERAMVMFSGGNLNNITCSNDTSRNSRWPTVHVHVDLIQCFLSYAVSSSWSGEYQSTRSDIMSLTTAAPAWRRPAQTLPSRKMWVALILTLGLLFLIQSGTNWWTATRTWPTRHTWQTALPKSKPLFKVKSLELEKTSQTSLILSLECVTLESEDADAHCSCWENINNSGFLWCQ